MAKKKMTATEVARLLGVSQSTVSRAFTPDSNISDSTRQRIVEAAAQLGYSPNAIARGLITQSSRIIGLLMRDINNPFYPEVLEKLSYGLKQKGYSTLFVNQVQDDITSSDMSQFMEYQVEGVIVTDALLSSSISAKLKDMGIPVVLFNRYIAYSSCSLVCCDNIHGGNMIAKYLIETGHKQMAYVEGIQNTSTSQDRKKGFAQVLQAAGHGEPSLTTGNFSYRGGFDATYALMRSGKVTDAIFYANDIMALGGVDALKEMGIQVPEAISVIGFDDIRMSAWTSYSLTTFQQPVDLMIEAAIEILLAEIQEHVKLPVSKLIQGQLVKRKTVADRSR